MVATAATVVKTTARADNVRGIVDDGGGGAPSFEQCLCVCCESVYIIIKMAFRGWRKGARVRSRDDGEGARESLNAKLLKEKKKPRRLAIAQLRPLLAEALFAFFLFFCELGIGDSRERTPRGKKVAKKESTARGVECGGRK